MHAVQRPDRRAQAAAHVFKGTQHVLGIDRPVIVLIGHSVLLHGKSRCADAATHRGALQARIRGHAQRRAHSVAVSQWISQKSGNAGRSSKWPALPDFWEIHWE